MAHSKHYHPSSFQILHGLWNGYKEVNTSYENFNNFHFIFNPFNKILILHRDRWLIATGQQGENFYNDVWAFDLKNYTWSMLETTGPSPPPRYGATGGIYPGSDVFWVTHGFAHRRFDDTWALDLNTLEWKEYSKNCVFR